MYFSMYVSIIHMMIYFIKKLSVIGLVAHTGACIHTHVHVYINTAIHIYIPLIQPAFQSNLNLFHDDLF